jgi:hypothetical protein
VQPIHWVLIAVAFVVYIGIRVMLNASARVSSLREWADLNSYTFQKEKDTSIGLRYGALTRLTQYGNCASSNVVRGPLGRYKFCAFDFVDINKPHMSQRRATWSHKHFAGIATSFAAVVVETDLDMPSVVIERETLADKVAKAFGVEDVQFESEEFNHRFMVRSRNKDRTIALLGPAVQAILIDTPLFDFSSSLHTLELNGPLVLARSRTDQFFTEKDYPEVLELLADMLTHIAKAVAQV